MRRPNAQYNLAKADSMATKIAAYQRRKMYGRFLTISGISPEETLLDVGATSERSYEASNYLEAWYPYKDRITAVGLDDASFLDRFYPGMTFRYANGLDLPFQNGAFDVVHSSAVLEHVGSREYQRGFVFELCRVARRGVFLTTPNRWFPVEFHTQLPLVHWLPKPYFHSLLRLTGRGCFASDSILNLLAPSTLRNLVPDGLDSRLSTVKLMGWPTNLLLWIETKPRPLYDRNSSTLMKKDP